MTTWKTVPTSPRYEVSDQGEVRKRINATHPERRQLHYMKQSSDKDGYLKVTLNRKHIHVHRVVYSAFCGGLSNGLVVCHLDGDKTNNSASNLSQVTQKENISHKRMHNTWQSCENHPLAKLTNEQALLIKRQLSIAPRSRSGRLARGVADQVAKLAGVHKGLVFNISRSRSGYAEL